MSVVRVLSDLLVLTFIILVTDHPNDAWIRVHLSQGDLLVLPAGIYHRFTLDEHDALKAMRLFKVSQIS